MFEEQMSKPTEVVRGEPLHLYSGKVQMMSYTTTVLSHIFIGVS